MERLLLRLSSKKVRIGGIYLKRFFKMIEDLKEYGEVLGGEISVNVSINVCDVERAKEIADEIRRYLRQKPEVNEYEKFIYYHFYDESDGDCGDNDICVSCYKGEIGVEVEEFNLVGG